MMEWDGVGTNGSNLLEKLLKGWSFGGLFVYAVHDEVAEVGGVATVLDILHCINEERLIDGESVKIVAVHAFANGGDFEHSQAHHKNFAASTTFQGVEKFDS